MHPLCDGAPGCLKVPRLEDESDPGILEQSVVDLPGAGRPDDVFTHDPRIRKQAQETRLSHSAHGDIVIR